MRQEGREGGRCEARREVDREGGGKYYTDVNIILISKNSGYT